jgi:hypothetical protein
VRLQINIDSIVHNIDSCDPELLGKWVIEILRRPREITPATWITVQAWPSYLEGDDGQMHMDWPTDGRYLGRQAEIRTPRDLVAALGKFLDEAEVPDGDHG